MARGRVVARGTPEAMRRWVMRWWLFFALRVVLLVGSITLLIWMINIFVRLLGVTSR